MRTRWVVLPTVLFVSACAARAQDDAGAAAFARLKIAIGQAQAASRSWPDDVRSEVNSYLSDSSNFTSALWERYRGSQSEERRTKIATVYVVSLNGDSSALEKLGDVTPPKDRPAVARDVRDDLKVKAHYTSQAAGIGGAFPSVVAVTVETERKGKKADDLWVRCNPRRDGVTKNPMFVFNSATSPTMSQLPPGFFIIWVEETKGGKVLTQQPVSIGDNGQDRQTIKLAIP
ncbi:MAG TPA: hypothetical protein VFC21_10015 [Bryobacteraceae bacterium]|nr:hypothetical protein [Bryobacteraceae bacterium]